METRKCVLDAAEKVFSDYGYDAATIRDIATEAGTPIGSVHHHGRGKENLFHLTVARRATTLSGARLDALRSLRAENRLSVTSLLEAFMLPFFELTDKEHRWRNYARIVAYLSADDRWNALSAEFFDPTVEIFLTELTSQLPQLQRHEIAEGFVFSVSAMLALLTSKERINTLGNRTTSEKEQVKHLIRFCAAGLAAHR